MELKEKLLETGFVIDNEYLDKYVALIVVNRHTKQEARKTNKHHILPKRYFKNKGLPVDNSRENIVNLIYKDHLLAHLYLSGCTVGQDRYWNLYSVMRLTGQKYLSKDTFEQIKNLDYYQTLYEEAISAAPNHRKGAKVSPETIQKMRDAQKNHHPTNKGTVWIHNDGEEIMIKIDILQEYLNNGYLVGRKYRHSEESLKKIADKSRGRRSQEFCDKMREITLNQPPKTQETIEKQRQSIKKYYETHENPFAGKTHSKESIDKMKSSLAGMVYVNKNGVQTKVHLEQLDSYIENGWSRGGLPRKRNQ